MKRFTVFALALLLFSGCDYWEVDKCLDNGGRWNYERGVCEFEESPHAVREKNDLCAGDEISRVSSPDKRVDAVVTKGNCGATTSYAYRVSVVPAGNTPVEGDTIFLADKAEGVSVAWQAPKKLVISYKEARIFKFTNFWSSKELDNSRYIVSAVEAQTN